MTYLLQIKRFPIQFITLDVDKCIKVALAPRNAYLPLNTVPMKKRILIPLTLLVTAVGYASAQKQTPNEYINKYKELNPSLEFVKTLSKGDWVATLLVHK